MGPYEEITPGRFNNSFTRANCAKVAARHVRLAHFFPEIVGHPLVVDDSYMAAAEWSQYCYGSCRFLLQARARRAERESRAEVAGDEVR